MRSIIASLVLAGLLAASAAQAALPHAETQATLPSCTAPDYTVLLAADEGWYFSAEFDAYQNALLLQRAGQAFRGKFVCRSAARAEKAKAYKAAAGATDFGSSNG